MSRFLTTATMTMHTGAGASKKEYRFEGSGEFQFHVAVHQKEGDRKLHPTGQRLHVDVNVDDHGNVWVRSHTEIPTQETR